MSVRKVNPLMINTIFKLTLLDQTKKEICKTVGISPGVLKKIRAGTYPGLDSASLIAWRKTFAVSDALNRAQSPKSPAHSVFIGGVKATVAPTPGQAPCAGR
ncbi:hypothetical protein [Candidatus Aalborgicola defluviihabitans]|uniref:hypothetical protein n=1 Tax=Candidatus Aalborgicola defluviihabitans TaxID=3386187 RepID=UPI001DE42A60|nr:hypothetical protein [Burkholderiales bacterium]